MKKIVFLVLVLVSIGFSDKTDLSKESIIDALKAASSGTVSSRFRFGYFLGLGYQGRVSGDGNTKIQGLLLEGGLYGLFNPIRNFTDIEIGISGKYNTGASTSSSSSNSTKYYAGLKQVTAYSGIVFRSGTKGKALALGISKALYIDEIQSDEMKAQNIKKHDLKNGIGVYAEYQTDEITKQITFVRVEVEKIDVVSDNKTSKDTLASILIGWKF